MQTSTIEIGRVIRLGRGWADVSINRKTRRVSVRPDLLIRVGDSLKIVHDQAVSCLRPQ
ncbi:hypothetical protein [Aggregatilinea lenta]|uniref:hypothetical protein n=1 Tax=Aggregatilinea lenta TaxID=913108 RepID=UPI0013C2DD33|nr:hypothetical protein [Aggregatilinea lenta]